MQEEVRVQYAVQIENISHQNKLIIEQGSRHHQLRIAALEKRLEVHQQAYTLWKKLTEVFREKDQVHAVVLECQEWWNRNCLYLEPEAREAFIQACHECWDSPFLMAAETRRRDPPELIKSSLATIMRPGPLLVKAVELPPNAEDKPASASAEDENTA